MKIVQVQTRKITLTHFFLLAVILLLKMQSGNSAVISKGDIYEDFIIGYSAGKFLR